MIFELSSGRELDAEVPVESDYELIKSNRGKVQEILEFIFERSEEISNGSLSYRTGLRQVTMHHILML